MSSRGHRQDFVQNPPRESASAIRNDLPASGEIVDTSSLPPLPRDAVLTFPCRYGVFSVFRFDNTVGRSLQVYGEWAQAEIDLLSQLLPSDAAIVDAGANIGSHTIAFASRFPAGRVLAFEPQPQVFQLLKENVAQNSAGNVTLFHVALDEQPSVVSVPYAETDTDANFGSYSVSRERGQNGTAAVRATTLDSLGLTRCDLIKCDVEGLEEAVLRGAQATIELCRPLIYAEARTVDDGLALRGMLEASGYSLWIHQAPAFNPDNCFGSRERIFGLARESNILAIPSERVEEWREILDRDASLVEVTSADKLAQTILDTPRWGEVNLADLTQLGLIARITRLFEDKSYLDKRLKDAFQNLTTAREQIEVEKEAAKQLAASMQTRLCGLERQKDALAEQLAETTRQMHAMRRQAEQGNEEIARLTSALAAAEAETATLRQTVADLTAARDAVEARSSQPADPMFDESLYGSWFDSRWYLENNPDVAASGVSPLWHYLTAGASERRDPHPQFKTSWYLESNPDVAASGINALWHFVTAGAAEGRLPHPVQDPVPESVRSTMRAIFDEVFYTASVPSFAESGMTAFKHFVEVGGAAGFDPHPLFDSSWYLKNNPDVAASGMNPLAHYVSAGAAEGRDPHPLFDSSFYLKQNPQVAATHVNPLEHFLTAGAAEGCDPHPLFDTSYYLGRYGDVAEAGVNPLIHFLASGWRENRDPHPLFDVAYYREQAREIGSDPITHFMDTGFRQGLDPHPMFDSSFYLSNQPELTCDGLSHFLLAGATAKTDPHPMFETGHYLSRCPDVARSGVNPLVHFALHGRDRGLEPKPVFHLGDHYPVLVGFDKLRADGKPVILAISHIGGGGTEKHVRELKEYVDGRCHFFLLSPANHHLFGPVVAGKLQLTPLGESSEAALLFDAAERLDDLIGVLRGIGVSRIHLHHILGHEQWIGSLMRQMAVPFDVTLHDYYFLSPQPQLAGPNGRYTGDPDDQADWQRRYAWLLNEADRVIVPSVDAAKRFRRYYPSARLIAAAHPSIIPFDRMAVVPTAPAAGENLRVLLIGELSIHKGRDVVFECARVCRGSGFPLEFHLAGFADAPVPEDVPLIQHGRYRDENLAAIIEAVAPHVVWFPALWPETFAYTLSAAMSACKPVVATEIGAFPERLAGRPWTWLAPVNYTPDQWCGLFARVREALTHNRQPEPPLPGSSAVEGFYDSEYIIAN